MSDIANTENAVTEVTDNKTTDTVTEVKPKKTRKRKTDEEQLQDLLKEKTDLLEKEKQIKARINEKKRKERTKHLIEMGGLIYSKLGREFIEGDVNRLATFIDGQEKRGNYFSEALNKGVDPKQISEATATKKEKQDS